MNWLLRNVTAHSIISRNNRIILQNLIELKNEWNRHSCICFCKIFSPGKQRLPDGGPIHPRAHRGASKARQDQGPAAPGQAVQERQAVLHQRRAGHPRGGSGVPARLLHFGRLRRRQDRPGQQDPDQKAQSPGREVSGFGETDGTDQEVEFRDWGLGFFKLVWWLIHVIKFVFFLIKATNSLSKIIFFLHDSKEGWDEVEEGKCRIINS